MSIEKENNIKKILEEQLKKLLGDSLTRLEKRNDEQFEVLKTCNSSFENYNNTLTKYVKEAEENEKIREQKEKEQREKEQKAKEEKEKKEKELKEKKEAEKNKAPKERTLKRNKTVGDLLKGTKKPMDSAKKESKPKEEENTPKKKPSSRTLESKGTAGKSTKDKVLKTQASEKSSKTRPSRKTDDESKPRTMVRSKTVKNLRSKPTLEKDKKVVKGKATTSKNTKKDEKKVEEKKVEEVKEEEKKVEEVKEEEKKEEVKEEEKKEEIKEEEKKEEVKEEKPIIRNPIDFYIKTYNEEKWMLNICSYLPKKEQLVFLSTTKLFKKHLVGKIKEYRKSIDTTLNIQEGETIDKKIEEFKSKAKEEQLNETPSGFTLTKGASKAIELLNQEVYQKVFNKTTLEDNLRGIIVIYRIIFKLMKNNDISLIENDDEFWIKCCEYFKSQSDSKIGSFLQKISSDFNFEENKVYLIQKLICESQAKINPAIYSKLCPTTGLFTFLIKDALEYCGVIINHSRNHQSIIYKNLLYDKEIIERVQKYIDYLEKI